jgi:hypothetical protein
MATNDVENGERGAAAADRALQRIVAEIVDGLRHGYFEFRVTCEVIGSGRRRVVLHAGKTYQFVIPAGGCERVDGLDDVGHRTRVQT